MSDAATVDSTTTHGGSADHGHGHNPHLAHHFDTTQQQFDSGKLGIWLFLVTEVLFFTGLFCAYAIYRSTHPEIFQNASQHLDTKWGAINTIVLLFSSLTMAWGVRCAQLGQKQGLVLCLGLTLACAFGFMGIKYVEYKAKWEHGLLWGRSFSPHEDHAHPAPTAGGAEAAHVKPHKGADADPRLIRAFFSIYFCMTGLHALHIVGGIAVLGWLMLRAMKGEFGPDYFWPIDYAGLYWHLVDLVWIFLFPLLYLIH